MSNYNIQIGSAQINSNRGLLRALSNQLKKIFQKSQIPLRSKIREVVKQALTNCPEVESLRSGTLKYDFGLVSDVTDLLVSNIVESIEIEYKPIQISFSGVSSALTIYINAQRLESIFKGSGWAYIPTENGQLPWLDWLLNAGDSIVIAGYSVAYGNWGRSGGAIMLKYNNFQVNPQYSGTISDNFITRAIEKNQEQIEKTLKDFKYG